MTGGSTPGAPTTPPNGVPQLRLPSADLPVTVLEPHPGWRLVDFKELWRYRELLYFLALRDVKLRYKQTALGVAWAVLQPLATMLVFSVFLGRTPGIADQIGYDYALFVFAGFLPWMFFANAVTTASQSVVANHSLVTKVYFPRLLIPTGAVAAAMVDFAVAASMLGVLMAWYGVLPGVGVVLAPVALLGLIVTALGVGTLLAALTVAYRDFRYVVPFAVQLWMFATPCIYLPNVEGAWGPLMPLNPAYGLILNFRQAMLGGSPDWFALSVSFGVGLLLLWGGMMYFRRVERSFADII